MQNFEFGMQRILPDSAILSTFIKLPFVLKTFVLSIFEWRLKTGFTEYQYRTFHNTGRTGGLHCCR